MLWRQLRNWSGPCYTIFWVNSGPYSVSLHIQSKCRKKLYNQDSITKKFCNIKILYIKNSINKNYKKAISNISKTINEQGKKMANKKNILDRIQVNGKEECFVTLKDHKPSFENNATARLISQAKNEIRRMSKVILENINKELRNKLQLQQWYNTTAVINWFKKIENKKQI